MDLSIELNTKSPRFGDLKLIDGDLVLTSDADTRGTHYVLQSVMQRLRMQRGEWFLNQTLGVPYLQQIFAKNPDIAQIEDTLRQVILSTPGVLSILRFETLFTRANRLLGISFSAETTSGVVSYTGPLNSPANLVVQ